MTLTVSHARQWLAGFVSCMFRWGFCCRKDSNRTPAAAPETVRYILCSVALLWGSPVIHLETSFVLLYPTLSFHFFAPNQNFAALPTHAIAVARIGPFHTFTSRRAVVKTVFFELMSCSRNLSAWRRKQCSWTCPRAAITRLFCSTLTVFAVQFKSASLPYRASNKIFSVIKSRLSNSTKAKYITVNLLDDRWLCFQRLYRLFISHLRNTNSSKIAVPTTHNIRTTRNLIVLFLQAPILTIAYSALLVTVNFTAELLVLQ